MSNEELAKVIETRTGEEGELYRMWLEKLLAQHVSPLTDALCAIAEETDPRNCRGTAERGLKAFEKQRITP